MSPDRMVDLVEDPLDVGADVGAGDAVVLVGSLGAAVAVVLVGSLGAAVTGAEVTGDVSVVVGPGVTGASVGLGVTGITGGDVTLRVGNGSVGVKVNAGDSEVVSVGSIVSAVLGVGTGTSAGLGVTGGAEMGDVVLGDNVILRVGNGSVGGTTTGASGAIGATGSTGEATTGEGNATGATGENDPQSVPVAHEFMAAVQLPNFLPSFSQFGQHVQKEHATSISRQSRLRGGSATPAHTSRHVTE